MTGPETLVGDRYRLLHPLGRGGMAQVRAAEDTVLGRQVAVKLFDGGGGFAAAADGTRSNGATGAATAAAPAPGGPPTVGGTAGTGPWTGVGTGVGTGPGTVEGPDVDARRAAAEMHTLARLSHPNLVAVYDAGTDAGRPFLVMEYVDGPTLAGRVADGGALPAEEVSAVGSGLAAGLAYIHARGIVHRDVKPANVLLPHRDHVTQPAAKLADFGIALTVGADKLTRTGLTIGTARYLAPEQARGDAVGPAADVYALGLVLLECLSGAPAWTGTPVEVAVARLSRPPAVPDTVPPAWRPVLTAATELDPARRPSAAQLRDELARLSDATVLVAPVAGAAAGGAVFAAAAADDLLDPDATGLVATAAPTRSRRRPLWYLIAGAAAAAAVVGGVALTSGGGDAHPADRSGTSTGAPTAPVGVSAAPITPVGDGTAARAGGDGGGAPGGGAPAAVPVTATVTAPAPAASAPPTPAAGGAPDTPTSPVPSGGGGSGTSTSTSTATGSATSSATASDTPPATPSASPTATTTAPDGSAPTGAAVSTAAVPAPDAATAGASAAR